MFSCSWSPARQNQPQVVKLCKHGMTNVLSCLFHLSSRAFQLTFVVRQSIFDNPTRLNIPNTRRILSNDALPSTQTSQDNSLRVNTVQLAYHPWLPSDC